MAAVGNPLGPQMSSRPKLLIHGRALLIRDEFCIGDASGFWRWLLRSKSEEVALFDNRTLDANAAPQNSL